MRLSAEQQKHIYQTILQAIQPHVFQVFLYGSRANDQLKGGDIDLLVKTSPEGKLILQDKRYEILNNLKKNRVIGDRKVDLAFATNDDIKNEAFYSIALASAVEIKL